MDKMRQDFEEWHKTTPNLDNFKRSECGDEYYACPDVQQAWRAWQAAIPQQAEAIGEISTEMNCNEASFIVYDDYDLPVGTKVFVTPQPAQAPKGWKIQIEDNRFGIESYRISSPDDHHCIVDGLPSAPPSHPSAMLFRLAKAILSAAPQPQEGEEEIEILNIDGVAVGKHTVRYYWSERKEQAQRIAELMADVALKNTEMKLAQDRILELEGNATRYQYIRNNQSWRRFGSLDDPDSHAVVGCKFPYSANFEAREMLDHHVDLLIAKNRGSEVQ